MAFQPQQKLHGNRYIIQKRIGQGGFGVTYLAKTKEGKPVVIKTLKNEVMTDPDLATYRDKYLGDFKDEALRLAVCRHPHIVQIDNVFQHQKFPCIAMEYIDGEDLWQKIRRDGPLSIEEALRYVRQIGEALMVVHEKGLLHRDLKPHNIMIRAKKAEAVLIDFGIAREFIPDATQTHTASFTPGFAPIEQYDEKARRGEFTDVYGLAATLYCLVVGSPPSPSFMRLVRDSLQIPTHLSKPLQEAIKQGMAIMPEDRPATVQEWLKLLSSGDSPQLPTYSFEIITVNRRGEVIDKRPGQASYFREDLGKGVSMDMVYIPGGSFEMGSPSDEKRWDRYDGREEPQHQVTLQPFFMGKYAITQAQWRAVAALPKQQRDLDPDPSYFKGDNRPVEKVSWYDAVEFCARLSVATGRQYCLPSEAQWEYAGRANTKTPFHFGETITAEIANYDGNYTYADEPKGEYREQTTPVGSFPPNRFGLYDMHGNVWEWCADPWHGNYEKAPTDGKVWDENCNDNRYQNHVEYLNSMLNNKSIKILRGGSWIFLPAYCRSALRGNDYPDYIHDGNGFRVVCVGSEDS
ncbi:MAG: SUMF1/EgtB/PvdO family nonheme iron enzyme [Spirulinaceae cyanobacterium]